ncbi:hypothetical protein GE061_008636 [Apolygus lucorum]|uniref:Uncharacterized protein n=1 Tax=Apolygus lucorum TaxID=248454 RepID=A0A8S9WJQ8_APOLU|nr:hypothetical protein GE061_008636 [Apolygus lucorum]
METSRMVLDNDVLSGNQCVHFRPFCPNWTESRRLATLSTTKSAVPAATYDFFIVLRITQFAYVFVLCELLCSIYGQISNSGSP